MWWNHKLPNLIYFFIRSIGLILTVRIKVYFSRIWKQISWIIDWDNFLHHNIRKLQMYSIQLKLEFYKLERTYDIDLLQFDIKLLNICPIQIWLNVSDSQCSTTNANLQVHSRNGMLLQVLCSIKSLEFLVIWISPNS